MDIKEFKKGQEAYLLNENKGYAREPEVCNVTVTSVGRKYVTVDDRNLYVCADPSVDYLVQDADWGSHTLLFKERKSLDQYLEKIAVENWLRKNGSKFCKLSLQQLREIRDIIETPVAQTIVFDFVRDGAHQFRSFSVLKSKMDQVCGMVEEARQAAIKDGCIGWASTAPDLYFENVGLHVVDVKTMTIDDLELEEPLYEKNEYFLPACKACFRYERGYCSRYFADTDPDDIETCFYGDDVIIYEIHYENKERNDILLRFYRNEGDNIISHSALEILQMFATTVKELTENLEQDDFCEDNLYISDEEGNKIIISD